MIQKKKLQQFPQQQQQKAGAAQSQCKASQSGFSFQMMALLIAFVCLLLCGFLLADRFIGRQRAHYEGSHLENTRCAV